MKSELKSAGMVRTIAALQEERDALQADNAALHQRVEELEKENERLKAEIKRLSVYKPKMPEDIRGFSMKGGK